MGARGPKPTPTALRLLRGNPGKRALPKGEPQPAPVRPKTPALPKVVAVIYEELATEAEAMGVLTRADGVALEAMAYAVHEMRRAHHWLERHPRDRLAAVRAREARAQVKLFSGLFGFNPADRTRIRVETPREDDFDEFLRRGETGSG